MYCINCGSENPDQARFCRVCGQRFDIEQKPTGPAAPSASPGQSSVSNTPIAFEQVWYRAPSEPTIADPPAALSNTPFTPPYGAPSSDAMLPTIVEPYPAPVMNISPSTAYSPYPPVAELQTPQVGIPYVAAEQPPGTPPASPAPRPSGFQALARPMPLLAVLCLVVLVLGVFIILFFTGSDWAAGALHLAIGAGSIALLILLVTVVRSFAGMASRANPKRVRQFISAGVAFLLLMLISLTGFSQQNTFHNWQAHWFEGQQQWTSAINEFQLAGERAPASENISRIFNEWGEQLSGQQQYQASFVKFDTVLNAFGSPADQVNRAQTDEINAYIGWAKQSMDAKSYSDATQRYDTLLQKPYCTASCQTQVSLLDATAYYDLAESQLGTQNYTDAVSNFALVLSRFPTSPEATKLHGDYAKALYGEGQAQLTSTCSSAIPTYQQLASQFGDTPQGQQAASALKAPQPVKGRFIGAVPHAGNLTDIAALMKGLYANMPNTVFYNILASSPQVTINSDGTFAFKPMPQGSYELAWGTNNTDGSQSFVFYTNQADNSVEYVAKVGPLCSYDFGDIAQDVPSAP